MNDRTLVLPEKMSSLLLSILEELNIDILITDLATDEILFINKKMMKEHGISANPCGKACSTVLSHTCGQECQFCPVRKLEQDINGVFSWETRNDATGKYYRKMDKAITWLDGRKARLHQSFDISQDKQNELRLEGAKKQAEHASKAKGEFLSRMSHEIRTPINAIIGMTHIALGAQTLEKAKQCLENIDVSSKQLLRVINDILDVSKIESQKMTIASEEFDFENMLMEVANIISVKSDEKHLGFHIQIDMNMPKFLIGDSLRISQVLLNLLSNAVKFTPEYGKIYLAAERVAQEDGFTFVKISVSDSGIGIPAENIGTLFDTFEQAEGGMARRFGGTGLGLTICKNLAEMMGGKLSVISEVGKGSTFCCELRLKNAASGETVSQACGGTDLRNIRVLLIDDSEDVRDFFMKIMGAFNSFAAVAESGEDGLELLERAQEQNKQFNVVLVDWHMPGMSGIETATRIKELYPGEVILVASKAELCEIEPKAKRAGITRFVSKPIFQSDLVNNLQEIIGLPSRKPNLLRLRAPEEFAGREVLLVEDIEINRDILAQELEDTKIVLSFAENGKRAVEEFCNHPEKYDLIFMDIHMPEMDGYEATKRIRESGLKGCKTIPIVAMTANAFEQDVQMCLEAGMNNHIAKPIECDKLYAMLRKYLTKTEKNMLEEPKMDNMLPEMNHADIKAYVNSEDALARVRGNTKVYKALLGSYLKSTQFQQMKTEIEAGDFDAAAKSAHAIKGVSANLSLPAVNELSIMLESQLKSGLPVHDSLKKMEEAVSKTADCIQVVLSQL